MTEAAKPPVVILVRPQMPENIGACARAMRNFGLTELRLVNPRERWPNEKAVAMAANAVGVLDDAKVFGTLEQAVCDLDRVYATTARQRHVVKPLLTPRGAAVEARASRRAGYLFGPERTGLEADEIAAAQAIVEIPADPDYASLNLAQAVLVCAYEWFQLGASRPDRVLQTGEFGLASQAELQRLYEHLESELETGGFFRTDAQKPTMVQNLRALFARASLTEQEVRTLRGAIKSLTTNKKVNKKKPG